MNVLTPAAKVCAGAANDYTGTGIDCTTAKKVFPLHYIVITLPRNGRPGAGNPANGVAIVRRPPVAARSGVRYCDGRSVFCAPRGTKGLPSPAGPATQPVKERVR